jgi:two-component system response regulator AtoC
MPTLAERKMDIGALAEFSLQVLSLMNDKPKVKLTEKALEKILQYNWPGQFYEFESILENAFSSAENNLIEPEHLLMGPLPAEIEIPVGMKLQDLERNYILQTLYFVHQNRTRAAEILGISIRTLRNKINLYRVEGYL